MTDSSDAAAEHDAARDWAASQLGTAVPLDEHARSKAIWRSLAVSAFRLSSTQHVAVDLLLQQMEDAPQSPATARLLADQEQALSADVVAEAEQFFQRSPYVRQAMWQRLQERVARHPRLESWIAAWRPGLQFEVSSLSEVQQEAFHQVARVWLAEPFRAGVVARSVAQQFASDPTEGYDLLVSLLPECRFLESAINRVLRELPVDEETCAQLAAFAAELRTLHEQPDWQLSQLRTIDPVATRYRTFTPQDAESTNSWLRLLAPFAIGFALFFLRIMLKEERSSKMWQTDRPIGRVVMPKFEPVLGNRDNMAALAEVRLRIRVIQHGLLELEDTSERSQVAAALRNTHLLTSDDGAPYDPGRIFRVLGEGPVQYVDDVKLKRMGLNATNVTIYQSTDFRWHTRDDAPETDEPVSALSVLRESRAGDVADE